MRSRSTASSTPPRGQAVSGPGNWACWKADGRFPLYQEILRKLAIIDEGCVDDQAGLGLGLPASRLDPKTAALARVGALAAIGAPGVCLEWSTTWALAQGANEEEITGVLLAIAPVAGLSRVTAAAPDVAAALGYDVEAALMSPDDL
jgi:4-carboxymuconolactone decarboxylase